MKLTVNVCINFLHTNAEGLFPCHISEQGGALCLCVIAYLALCSQSCLLQATGETCEVGGVRGPLLAASFSLLRI